MSVKSHYRRTTDRRRCRVGAGLGVVSAGAIGAALFSAAFAPAARADDLDPFEDLLPSNSIFQPDAAILDATIVNDYPNGAYWAGIFDSVEDNPYNVGPLITPGAEPIDPFEDLAGTNSGMPLFMDTLLYYYQPAIAVLLDHTFDALPPPDNDALADLTQAFGATGAAFIAGLEQAMTGMPITDAMADIAIASAGLGPF